MKEAYCPKGFACYTSKLEDLCPTCHHLGTNLVLCQSAAGNNCPMSILYGLELRLCMWQLRKYVAIELGK
jgi:hypothetical protein